MTTAEGVSLSWVAGFEALVPQFAPLSHKVQ